MADCLVDRVALLDWIRFEVATRDNVRFPIPGAGDAEAFIAEAVAKGKGPGAKGAKSKAKLKAEAKAGRGGKEEKKGDGDGKGSGDDEDAGVDEDGWHSRTVGIKVSDSGHNSERSLEGTHCRVWVMRASDLNFSFSKEPQVRSLLTWACA